MFGPPQEIRGAYWRPCVPERLVTRMALTLRLTSMFVLNSTCPYRLVESVPLTWCRVTIDIAQRGRLNERVQPLLFPSLPSLPSLPARSL